jgi:hypothetical protein
MFPNYNIYKGEKQMNIYEVLMQLHDFPNKQYTNKNKDVFIGGGYDLGIYANNDILKLTNTIINDEWEEQLYPVPFEKALEAFHKGIEIKEVYTNGAEYYYNLKDGDTVNLDTVYKHKWYILD